MSHLNDGIPLTLHTQTANDYTKRSSDPSQLEIQQWPIASKLAHNRKITAAKHGLSRWKTLFSYQKNLVNRSSF